MLVATQHFTSKYRRKLIGWVIRREETLDSAKLDVQLQGFVALCMQNKKKERGGGMWSE